MVSNEKAESLIHFTLKCLVYKILKEAKHNAEIERKVGTKGRVDVVDWSENLVYEIETNHNLSSQVSKVNRYTNYAGIRDIIFILVKDYSEEMSIKELYKKLKEKIGL